MCHGDLIPASQLLSLSLLFQSLPSPNPYISPVPRLPCSASFSAPYYTLTIDIGVATSQACTIPNNHSLHFAELGSSRPEAANTLVS
ncbi:hypothetical protein M011DRAFT_17755 [Sporormia fimetaria CBS 119925]|uniref:Uncharacterized protein n=1 Tax=Sporormia fimetaria CBS 119925 TaxID=1340428 RepID=A0A6A6VSE7_9PLEO|nr:hypothetical protein M011DRAFT_17755 [Sporormia fimetaria CBS 119925]